MDNLCRSCEQPSLDFTESTQNRYNPISREAVEIWSLSKPIDVHHTYFARFRPFPNSFRFQPLFNPYGACVPNDILHTKNLGTDEYIFHGLPNLLGTLLDNKKKAWALFDEAYDCLTTYSGYHGKSSLI